MQVRQPLDQYAFTSTILQLPCLFQRGVCCADSPLTFVHGTAPVSLQACLISQNGPLRVVRSKAMLTIEWAKLQNAVSQLGTSVDQCSHMFTHVHKQKQWHVERRTLRRVPMSFMSSWHYRSVKSGLARLDASFGTVFPHLGALCSQ